ncbi:glycerate kinase [Lucifera butyrica]|uniref:Glycerate kinase n=1 Tax=Lucifera butyrica TaxID=1351585 RepID=A0A498RAS1_9FIRM|nr:glycerate kinase [Lucifera butyrica]VBB07223.1 glycerate kinase [Lucifera butyrica]
MKIVVAPDSFKGSVSAFKAAIAMEKGVKSVFLRARVIKVPIADGGEGTVEAMVAAAGGNIQYELVRGPLQKEVKAAWGLIDKGETAVIEMAAASGLTLVEKEQRDPRITTTYGTGQLILAALQAGAKRIIIGIGGSATNDGGMGMLKALGVKFLDAKGEQLAEGGSSLKKLAAIDTTGLDARLKDCEIVVACDVDNPLCGSQGAAASFGPQKGATTAMIAELDAALYHYAQIAKMATGKDMAAYPGAGAAGGLGAGLLFFTNAKLCPGVDIILESVGFAALMASTNLVITGEGCTDFQTAHGKAPVGVAKLAKQFGVPVVCLSGSLGKEAESVLNMGIDGLMSVIPGPMNLEECIINGEVLIESAAARLCRLLKTGILLAGS